MKTKLTNNLCYMAGLASKGKEKSFVGISTNLSPVLERFVLIAINDLKILPSKIVFEDDKSRKVYFFHSRVAKQLREIVAKEIKIFSHRNEFSANYLAGIFDSSGHVTEAKVYIKGLTRSRELLFENLGFHTSRGKIRNVNELIVFIKKFSSLLQRINLH